MTNIKTLLLAATAALSLGAGAAMAQEVDAQFLPRNAVPVPTYQKAPTANAGVPTTGTYTVQSGRYAVYPDPGEVGGSDGSGSN